MLKPNYTIESEYQVNPCLDQKYVYKILSAYVAGKTISEIVMMINERGVEEEVEWIIDYYVDHLLYGFM